MFSWLVLEVASLTSFLQDVYVSGCGNCTDQPVFSPSRLVVKHGDPTSATCSVCQSACINTTVGLERSVGDVTTNGTVISWSIDSLTEWGLTLFCYYTEADSGSQCCAELPVTVYKPPDNVSLSVSNHSGPMLEAGEYTLLCTVHDVAPVQTLTVTFYRGQAALARSRSYSNTHKPVTETHTLNITMRKEDDGAQYRCEAELELVPEGPQLPLVEASHTITATVYYKPKLQGASHPDVISITEGDPLRLSCSAEGNPSPSYTWTLPANRTSGTSSSLTVSSVTAADGGRYTCSARNSAGAASVTFTVTVQRLARTTVGPPATRTSAPSSGSSVAHGFTLCFMLLAFAVL